MATKTKPATKQVYIARGEVEIPEVPIIAADKQLVTADEAEFTVSDEAIAAAQFPVLYVAARDALKDCDKVDEVKAIDDKWMAIAMYAKQAKDKELMNLARRIGLRAERRIGELFNELRGSQKRSSDGPFSATATHGLSKDVVSRAIAFAGVPEQEFEEVLNRPEVPSKTAYAHCLAGLATAKIPKTKMVLRKEVFAELQEFYQFWNEQNINDVQKSFQYPEAKSAAIILAERIASQIASFRREPKTHQAALSLIEKVESQIQEFKNLDNKKTPEAVVDAIELQIRQFLRVLKA